MVTKPFNKVDKKLMIFIVVFAFVIRMLCINYGLPSENLRLSTYHPDEAIVFIAISEMEPKKLNFHPGDSLYWGSVYTYFVAIALKISALLGYIPEESRRFYEENLEYADRLYIVGRLITIFASLMSIFMMYLIGKELYDYKVGLFSALIFAILPGYVVYSIYVRPDILSIFFGLLCMWFAIKLLRSASIKHCILSGLCAGLAGATKYSSGAYLLVPMVVLLFHRHKLKMFLILSLSAFLGFILSCPYAILDYDFFLKKCHGSLARGPRVFDISFLYGTFEHLTSILPYGIGMPVCIFGFIGIIYSFFKFSKKDLISLIPFLIMFLTFCTTQNRAAVYTLPVFPFLCLFCSKLTMQIKWKIKPIIIFFIFFYTFFYLLSHLNLYTTKNIRVEVSEWIDRNIPKTATIGLVKSFFWTPPIIRQYHPPYKLFVGPPKITIGEGVELLMKNIENIDYIVLSHFESDILISPSEKKKLQMALEKFDKIMKFEKKLNWYYQGLLISPGDLELPNPRFFIYKKKL